MQDLASELTFHSKSPVLEGRPKLGQSDLMGNPERIQKTCLVIKNGLVNHFRRLSKVLTHKVIGTKTHDRCGDKAASS